MPSSTPASLRQVGAALRAFLALTVILGLAYPLTMTGAAHVLFSDNAVGSLVTSGGEPVGSGLIGQAFTRPVLDGGEAAMDVDGVPVTEPDPAYFQPRPSAAGAGYDPLATSASNYGPENGELVALIEERRTAVADLDGVAPGDVAPEALLASGSGLDPHISPEYAEQQVARVARERGLDENEVRQLVQLHTSGRMLGFLGEEHVNVLLLNLALDHAHGASSADPAD